MNLIALPISAKGLVTIPKKIRTALKLDQSVILEIQNDYIVIKKGIPGIETVGGSLNKYAKGLDTDDALRIAKETRYANKKF